MDDNHKSEGAEMRHLTISCAELAALEFLGMKRGNCCPSCHADADSGMSGMELSRIKLPCGCVVETCCLQYNNLYWLTWDVARRATFTSVLHALGVSAT